MSVKKIFKTGRIWTVHVDCGSYIFEINRFSKSEALNDAKSFIASAQ